MKKTKRRSGWNLDKEKIAVAVRVLDEANHIPRDSERLLQALAGGKTLRSPLRSESTIIASLFESVHGQEAAQLALRPDEVVLRELIAFCQLNTDLLAHQDAPRFANVLLALAAHRADWIRPLKAWRARSHNAERQIHSLLRHLIAAYDVPAFMDTAWLAGLTHESVKFQRWYKLIARGQNIRTADDLPFPMTKRQAHQFLRAPDDFDIPSAFRWALVVGLGGNERLVRSLLETRLGTHFENEEFWSTVIRFFIDNPELNRVHYGPIIDFLHNQKFVASVPNPLAAQPGQSEWIPPQPNLSMKGRTPHSLRLAIMRWHNQLHVSRSQVSTASWGPSSIAPFTHEDGFGEDRRLFEIRMLMGAAELIDEGIAMRHCVAAYSPACESGRSSIWSLRVRLPCGRLVRLATVEVRSIDRMVVQVRRRSNRRATVRELSILRKWADSGGPSLAWWLTV